MNTYRLTLLAVFAVGLVSSAHPELEGKRDDAIQWGGVIQGCRMSLVPDHEAFHVSQPVPLRLILNNLGEDPVHVVVASLLEVYQFDVLTPTSEVAALTPAGKRKMESISTHLQIVPPGESVTDIIPDLSKIFDMTMLGEYTVTLHRNILVSENGHVWIRLSSNTINLRIHDDEAVEEDSVIPTAHDVNEIVPKANERHMKLDDQGRIIEF